MEKRSTPGRASTEGRKRSEKPFRKSSDSEAGKGYSARPAGKSKDKNSGDEDKARPYRGGGAAYKGSSHAGSKAGGRDSFKKSYSARPAGRSKDSEDGGEEKPRSGRSGGTAYKSPSRPGYKSGSREPIKRGYSARPAGRANDTDAGDEERPRSGRSAGAGYRGNSRPASGSGSRERDSQKRSYPGRPYKAPETDRRKSTDHEEGSNASAPRPAWKSRDRSESSGPSRTSKTGATGYKSSSRPGSKAGSRPKSGDRYPSSRPGKTWDTGKTQDARSKGTRRPYGESSGEDTSRNPDRKEEYSGFGRPVRSEQSRDRTPSREGGSYRDRKPAGAGPSSGSRHDKKPHRGQGTRPAAASGKSTSRNPKTSGKDDGALRLNKYIGSTGLCSRREADEMIQQGLISVNGKIVTELGVKIGPEDEVRFNGELLREERKVYVLLNKPKDVTTTTDDPHAKITVLDLVRNACRERLYPVGRLDRTTTGVLLLTNDGDLAKKLTHPKYNKKKVYHVFLDKKLKSDDYKKILEGVMLEDGFIQPDEMHYVEEEDHTQMGVEIHSGRNRIVRRIFEHFGYRIKKLDRVYFAGLTKKGVERGHWRFLTEREIKLLKTGAYE